MDIQERADAVEAIAIMSGGNVLGRDDGVMTIEIRADVAPGLMALWGTGKFSPIFQGQDTRLAPRLTPTMSGQIAFGNRDDLVTTAFYKYTVEL